MHLTPHQSQSLNVCCTPQTLDRVRLYQALASHIERDVQSILHIDVSHPHLFADEIVYVSKTEIEQIGMVVSAIERMRGNQHYSQTIKARSGGLSRINPGTLGLFNSYDFHLTDQGPMLVEINTNAGGAFLNAPAAISHRDCCGLRRSTFGDGTTNDFENRVAHMLAHEWKRAGRTTQLRTIAIVDDDPKQQFLHPEFLLAQAMFNRLGYTAIIAAPEELSMRDGKLFHDSTVIDLVYNRLTDFALTAPTNTALHQAAISDAAVITPHPHHHAMLADKRSLLLLSDPTFWKDAGVPAQDHLAHKHILPTQLVTQENASSLWQNRKNLYFKPISGHAGKGVYRGAKITKSVWERVISGGYIAQKLAKPSLRKVTSKGKEVLLKTDIRAYTYGDEIIMFAARLYQGQTTNMRTPGGGFAHVVQV